MIGVYIYIYTRGKADVHMDRKKSDKQKESRQEKPRQKRRTHTMNVAKKRIAKEIKAFKNNDFSDCPELTDEQLKQLKPSRLRPQAEAINNNGAPFALKHEAVSP
jgi:hypothetical protein